MGGGSLMLVLVGCVGDLNLLLGDRGAAAWLILAVVDAGGAVRMMRGCLGKLLAAVATWLAGLVSTRLGWGLRRNRLSLLITVFFTETNFRIRLLLLAAILSIDRQVSLLRRQITTRVIFLMRLTDHIERRRVLVCRTASGTLRDGD